MISLLLWYGVLAALGWAIFPIVFKLLPGLAERGFTLTRTFGLLLWGYIFWILGTMGILENNRPGILFSLFVLLCASGWMVWKTGWEEIREWLRENRPVIITAEILFLAAFLAWGFVRANNPEIMGTEKPMELAFINAIQRSADFPPHDPWMSGYSISYYYFGYLLVAMLATLTATAGSVAFNLGNVMVFSLTAITAYGLVYNLAAAAFRKEDRSSIHLGALLGPFFTLIVSNWEGFLHFLHARGVFWRTNENGQLVSAFWERLDIQDLSSPPIGEPFGHWWWWRASRVIQDYDFNGVGKEVISEFPFFSYLLGDLHAHVLAMPFGFLCLGIALNLLLVKNEGGFRWLKLIPLRVSLPSFLVISLAAGGMSFLNAWDFPIYVAVVAGAYTLRNILREQTSQLRIQVVLGDFFLFGLAAGVTGGVLYLPFYIGFSSQAGGLLPNLIYITHGDQLWVMFGPLFVLIFAFLFYSWSRQGSVRALKRGLVYSLYLVGLLIAVVMVLVLVIVFMPSLFGVDAPLNVLLGSLGATSVRNVLLLSLTRRLVMPVTGFTLLVVIVLSLSLLLKDSEREGRPRVNPGMAYAWLMIFLGGLLVLAPEFVYLKDLFGYRINTIFKFYYQAWLLWSTAGAFAVLVLARGMKVPLKIVFGLVVLLSTAAALFYPARSLVSKTNNFNPGFGRTLDGAVYFQNTSPDDYQAAQWLKDAPFGVVAEAVGGSYSSAARISTYSGLPAVLGWDFHEIQWRGDSTLVTPRQQDMTTLYCTSHWNIAQPIIEKYNIRYVVIGQKEYSTYSAVEGTCPDGLRLEKFEEHLTLAARFGGTNIYLVE